VFSIIQRARVQKRWDKTTPEERYRHSQRMNEAKAAKAAERGGVVVGEPRLPHTGCLAGCGKRVFETFSDIAIAMSDTSIHAMITD
jgi:hypothetical protein